MIGSLRGRLMRKRATEVLIETNGVGYEVHVAINNELPGEGNEVFLYIHTHVREDALQLYGFMRDEERLLFSRLISVSGIGPRIALATLSGLSVERFAAAIEGEDVAMLSRIPGIGKKTAQRLILELKGKLPSIVPAKDTQYEDALSALLTLGYKKADIVTTLDVLNKRGIKDIETLIREALKYLSEGATGTSDN
ncbi:Holliday junction branch migration protein RuvA [Candidatus Magnetobacterium casense]|uniref:Holliday junction branch migration complex subunit RuvA n=1 Tax=Candidatus Magnetobacterium casense TaxID=1455061 RepID=A0ABS6RZP5_9BACT|nr:Holliday junction branch migration protein RuvA [Candidatus Magnetobacterium casensis]MBV6342036.1 Holliday junction branch migration protein RuvA [Candidatus Magnetobacterium casensis]